MDVFSVNQSHDEIKRSRPQSAALIAAQESVNASAIYLCFYINRTLFLIYFAWRGLSPFYETHRILKRKKKWEVMRRQNNLAQLVVSLKSILRDNVRTICLQRVMTTECTEIYISYKKMDVTMETGK